MSPPALLVLLRDRPGSPPPPESLPLGRAALRLEAGGPAVLFGADVQDGVARGLRARPGGWTAAVAPVLAAHDRFPGWSWPEPWARALAGLAGRPVGNPPWLTELCRDKLACQRVLEDAGVACPAVEDDPARFRSRLAEWGGAFLKPRHGSLGRGVRFVRDGDPLPPEGPGAGTRTSDANLLQRAVLGRPPLALRLVLQREDTGWRMLPPIARRSDDPVVNVERGATASPAEEVLDPVTLTACEALAREACAALLARDDAAFAVELGFDVVLDGDGTPWVIEVNPVPRGRLRVLADRDEGWRRAHEEACIRPLRWLAERANGGGR